MKTILTLVAVMTSVIGLSLESRPASAQPPRVAHADIDYEASGFVMPAGGPMPAGAIAGLTSSGPVQASGYAAQAGPGYVPPMSSGGYGIPTNGYQPGGAMRSPVQQVGYFGGGGSGCDSCGGACGSGCDSGYDMGGYAMDPSMYPGMMYGGCDGSCGGMCGGTGACGGGGVLSNGGVLGKMYGGDNSELSGLRHICIFCRGEGCEACQMFSGRSILACVAALAPYTEAGRCSQRWYDLSVEGLFLDRSSSYNGPSVITRRGVGAGGTPVISSGDFDDDGLEAGVRISGALIFGAGGNIEATYMGGQEWDSSATATSPAVLVNNPGFDPGQPTTPANQPFLLQSGADLYSFISDFGTNPANGFDDTDRSVSQQVTSEVSFHSGELNYRRRTVGPYCRFQGSWLLGLRYFRYENGLGLNIVGLQDDGTGASVIDENQRFFSTRDNVENDMFGAQIGGDLWYNLVPGIQLGTELKGAWLKNDVSRDYRISANSIGGGGPGTISDSFGQSEGVLALEFSAQAVYRLSHSWSFRSAYYVIAIDEVAGAEFDADFIRDAVQSPTGVTRPGFDFDSLTLSGFSLGAEYIW